MFWLLDYVCTGVQEFANSLVKVHLDRKSAQSESSCYQE